MAGHWICELTEEGITRIQQETDVRPGMPTTKLMMHSGAALDAVRETALDIFVLHRGTPLTRERRLALLERLATPQVVRCTFVGSERGLTDDGDTSSH